MPLTAIQPSHKEQQLQQRHMAEMSAVALAEPSAAKVSFQRHSGSNPPTQNANSAPSSLSPAAQFSGSIANYAVFAEFAAFSAHSEALECFVSPVYGALFTLTEGLSSGKCLSQPQ